ncbi:DUF2971 domain-containing protein [Vogesella sp. GCM10023246]|uniref:DUF2971 domain-containing protein n=1 Tax=Vogesella oryzagri TaxID=3160864 RepID=A0ABV1M7L6_9NEIS
MKKQIEDDARRALLHATRGISSHLSLNDIQLERNFKLLSKEERISARKGSDDAPVFLYKYYPPPFKQTGKSSFDADWRAEQNRRLENLIIDGKLYLSSRNQFNDPFDTMPRYTTTPMLSTLSALADRSLKKYGTTIQHSQRKKIKDNLIKNSNKIFSSLISAYRDYQAKFGIYCLSETNNSLLMWAHYALNHTGICIEFDTSEDFMLAAILQKVIYTPENKRPTINITEPSFLSTYEETFLTKSIDWNYELEWRLICDGLAGQELTFENSTITKIILGAKAHEETISDILNLNRKLENKGFPTLAIHKAELCDLTYGLKIVPFKT